jgi:hypothetical protein
MVKSLWTIGTKADFSEKGRGEHLAVAMRDAGETAVGEPLLLRVN